MKSIGWYYTFEVPIMLVPGRGRRKQLKSVLRKAAGGKGCWKNWDLGSRISLTEVYFKSKTRATKSREQVIAAIQELFLEQDTEGMVVSPLASRDHEPAHYYIRDPSQHIDVPLGTDYVDRGDWSEDDLKEFEGRF